MENFKYYGYETCLGKKNSTILSKTTILLFIVSSKRKINFSPIKNVKHTRLFVIRYKIIQKVVWSYVIPCNPSDAI